MLLPGSVAQFLSPSKSKEMVNHHVFIPVYTRDCKTFKKQFNSYLENLNRKDITVNMLMDEVAFDNAKSCLSNVIELVSENNNMSHYGDDKNSRLKLDRENMGTFIHPEASYSIYRVDSGTECVIRIIRFNSVDASSFKLKNGESVNQDSRGMGVVEISAFPGSPNPMKLVTIKPEGIGFKRWFALEFAKWENYGRITVIDENFGDFSNQWWSEAIDLVYKEFEKNEENVVLIGPGERSLYTYSVYKFYTIDVDKCKNTRTAQQRDIQYRCELQIMGEDGVFAHECNAVLFVFKSIKIEGYPKLVRKPMKCNQERGDSFIDILPYFNLFEEEYLQIVDFGGANLDFNMVQLPGDIPIVFGKIKLNFSRLIGGEKKSLAYFPSARFGEKNYEKFVNNLYNYHDEEVEECKGNLCSVFSEKDRGLWYYWNVTDKKCKEFKQQYQNPYFMRWYAIATIYLFWKGLVLQKEIDARVNRNRNVRVYNADAYETLIEVLKFWQKVVPYGKLHILKLTEFCDENLKPRFDRLYSDREDTDMYVNPMWVYCLANNPDDEKFVDMIVDMIDNKCLLVNKVDLETAPVEEVKPKEEELGRGKRVRKKVKRN
jgi:hypothetical protein